MRCAANARNCELPRESKCCGCKMLNNGRVCLTCGQAAAAGSGPAASAGLDPQPDMSRRLMAANAGSVMESLAALEAMGCEQKRAITNSALGTMYKR
jgi:hypothetical protein